MPEVSPGSGAVGAPPVAPPPALRRDGGGQRSTVLAFAALTLSGLCYVTGFPLGKLALRELAPVHMILLRFACASLLAAPFALGREARALFRSAPVLLAGLFYGLAFLVQFEGLARVTVTMAALLVGAMPALVAVTARLVGEPVSRLSWTGVAAATLGAGLIAGRPGDAGTPLGIALSLAALLVFLAWLFTLKRAPATRSPLAVPAVTVIVATATILPVALLLDGPPPLRLAPLTWVGIVGQGLFATFLATTAWSYGSARVGSAAAGVFINIEPLIGAIVGITLFGDPVRFTLILGGLLIIGGSIVVVLGERPGGTDPAGAAHGLSTS